LEVVVEAENEEKAFSRVRSNFCIIDDSSGDGPGELVSFEISEDVTELDEEDLDEEGVA